MEQAWRWFGPDDPVSLDHVRQAGATGIVTALHHRQDGTVWPDDEVLQRRREIEAAGLVWSVVESIPVPDAIKLGGANAAAATASFADSLRAVGRAGIRTVCYNFMPVVDWTRTDLMWRLPSTGYALRFDAVDFAAYDVFILCRRDAEADHRPEVLAQARARVAAMSEGEQATLERTIIAGLPGVAGEVNDRARFEGRLALYAGMTAADLRASHAAFLRAVVPVAEEAGVRLAVHPDDPPFPLFGLPRVVSTGRICGPSSLPWLAPPTGSPSAPAPWVPVSTMTSRRWPRSSRRTSISLICATSPPRPTDRSTRPSISTAARTWWP